jgi:hypothetical protein
MQSENYPHTVTAIYQDAEKAEAAVAVLELNGLHDTDHIKVARLTPDAGDDEINCAIEPEVKATRDTVIKDTVAGAATGTAAGAVTAAAAAALSPTLFVSTPLMGPLLALGYGAMIGGTVGGLRGMKLRKDSLLGLTKDSLTAGYHVVIVHTDSEEAQQRVEKLIDTTLAEETAST